MRGSAQVEVPDAGDFRGVNSMGTIALSAEPRGMGGEGAYLHDGREWRLCDGDVVCIASRPNAGDASICL